MGRRTPGRRRDDAGMSSADDILQTICRWDAVYFLQRRDDLATPWRRRNNYDLWLNRGMDLCQYSPQLQQGFLGASTYKRSKPSLKDFFCYWASSTCTRLHPMPNFC